MWQKGLRLALLLTMALGASLALAKDPALRLFGGEGRIVQYAQVGMTARQQEGFAEFAADLAYFGAFAVDTENGAWGYASGYHSQTIAERGAQRICEMNALGKPCTVIAGIIPTTLPAKARNAIGLSRSAEAGFTGAYASATANKPADRYAAFAIGGRAWAYEADATSADDARLKARRTCDRIELTQNQRKAASFVSQALAPLGAYTCRVIDVR